MKKIHLASVFLWLIQGCQSEPQIEKHTPKPQAVMLYKNASRTAMTEKEYNVKVENAINLLEKAIKIDSLYIQPHVSIIGFAFLNKDKTDALAYCKRAQRIFKNYPEFITMEGLIYEVKNETEKAESLHNKALDIYENELIDKMDKNPSLKLDYIACLFVNNQKTKAQEILTELKLEQKQNPTYKDLTLEIVMQGYFDLIQKNKASVE